MSVIELQLSDAQSDANLVIHFEEGWSRLRSGHSEREVFAYSVKSDSGKVYETEIFKSDIGSMCGYCACPARVVCRHLRAVLADLLERNPEFGSVD
jgi:hypothetical protein